MMYRNGEDDQGPAVECRVKFRQRCDAAKSAVAQAEVSRYLRFVVADPREPVELKAAVEACLGRIIIYRVLALAGFT